MGKVRILNTKTGAVKFVAEHIANDTKTLNMYGFIKQDLPKKEEPKTLTWEETRSYVNPPAINKEEVKPTVIQEFVAKEEPIEFVEEKVFEPEVFDGMAKVETIEETKARYFEITGKKAGIKKQETLLKELQALETKQD